MEAKKIFSKLNIKNYNNELEGILEEKLFSSDVKNLLLSMLYKIENAYKDYTWVKVEVLSAKELISYIIQIIKEQCFDIEFISPNSEEKPMVDKEKGKIRCYPNEKSLLSAIWYMGEKETQINVKYTYTKEAMRRMTSVGSNMSISEVLRDFNGWAWDIVTKELENIQYNILYQSMLLLDGKRLLSASIKSEREETILTQRDRKEFTDFFYTLTSVALNLYQKENKEAFEKIEKIKKDKQEELDLFQNKTEFVGQITDTKKKCIAEIEKIDRISNNTDLLKKEYRIRNEKLPNKEKIFSISHLVDRLDKEREELLTQLQRCNKMVDPKEFVKEKARIEEEVTFLQEEKSVIDVVAECLEASKTLIDKSEEKTEIIDWIYKIRYYCQIPYDEEKSLKDVKKLEKNFKDVIKLIMKKAQEHKIWDIFTENNELAYIVIKEIFYSKMIDLENMNITCDYKDGILYTTYYDGNVVESKSEFKIENVRIKKKIKLFIF